MLEREEKCWENEGDINNETALEAMAVSRFPVSNSARRYVYLINSFLSSNTCSRHGSLRIRTCGYGSQCAVETCGKSTILVS